MNLKTIEHPCFDQSRQQVRQDLPKRFRVGIYDPSRGLSSQVRYTKAIVDKVNPEEFEIIIFGFTGGPYCNWPDLSFIAIHDQPSSEISTTVEKKIDEPADSKLLPRLWKHLAPKPIRAWTGMLREANRQARSIRRQSLDLFHTNNTGCEESPIAARLAGVPRILGTFHVDSTYDLMNERSGFEHRILEQLSNRSLHKAIAVSAATKEDWIRRTGIRSDRVVTIHNGIDPAFFGRRMNRQSARRFLEIPDDGRLLVGGVGRLDEAKGFTNLIHALAKLKDTHPDLGLVLAGDGPLRTVLADLSQDLGIADRVYFLGFRQDVQPVYDALDVFVLPSLCETLGYAHLEAMATHLPVIGTHVGGVPEVIVDGTTGFIVPPRDPEALAASLKILLEDESLRVRMGEAGRHRVVQHFNQDDCVDRTIDLYREMIRGVDRRGPSSTNETAPKSQVR